MRSVVCLGVVQGVCSAAYLDDERKPFELPIDPTNVSLTRLRTRPTGRVRAWCGAESRKTRYRHLRFP
jgi:hypothetical protein